MKKLKSVYDDVLFEMVKNGVNAKDSARFIKKHLERNKLMNEENFTFLLTLAEKRKKFPERINKDVINAN